MKKISDDREKNIILDEFPIELNPELFKTSFDWDEEEKKIIAEERKQKLEKLKSFLNFKKKN